ncbi:hypothetical protein M405DRAFT_154307 [Rhizopogon salebrosus TDB-379]|nr:hypothetical protein M405DRAFT_154307 [Rhizopogon salebrosus TDB-379]
MLGTSVRLFEFNFVFHSLCFFSLFNTLSCGVQATPICRERGVSSRTIEPSQGTLYGQHYGMHPPKFQRERDCLTLSAAVPKRLRLHHASSISVFDGKYIFPSPWSHDFMLVFTATTSSMASVSTGAMSTVSCWLLSASASSTSCDPSSSASSSSTACTSSSTSAVASNSPHAEVGGTPGVETSNPASSPTPVGSSPVVPLLSPAIATVTASSVVTLSEGDTSSTAVTPLTCVPVIPPLVSPAVTSIFIPPAQEPPVATSTEGTAIPPAVTPPAVRLPTVPPASPQTPTIIRLPSPPAVPAPPVVIPSQGGPAAARPSVGGPGASVSGTSVPPSPAPLSTQATAASSANAQSQSSSQVISQPTSSPPPTQNNASTTKLPGSLIAIITVFSFLGLLSLTLGVIVFIRTKRSRMAQRQRVADVESRRLTPQNLSSRFSVSTTASVPVGQFRLSASLLLSSRAPA